MVAESTMQSSQVRCTPPFVHFHYWFTGKERDSESGLDYFGARYYGSALGRFTSPDWAANPQGVPYANLEDPQTLNLYGYVRNNPLSKPDPDGHDAQQTLTPEQAQEAGAGIADFTKGFYNGLVSGVNLLLPSSAQLPTAAVNSSPAGVLGTVLSMAVPVGGEASAVAEGGAAAVRAGELAGAMGKTKDFVTVAVTETKEGINVVSSSENALRPAVSSMLKNGEVAAQGAGHAEVTGIDAAKKMGLTPTGTAASRGICQGCWDFMKAEGVKALSALKKNVTP